MNILDDGGAGFLDFNWTSPGPVSTAFMASNKRVQIINGPVGGGKTTSCFVKALTYANLQKPSTRDGFRKFKLCVVRDTYRQLWKTTLPTWWKRVPRSEGDFTGAENAPCTHRVTFELNDGTRVKLQVDFVGIGENAVEDVLRGYEPTAFLLNECDLLARDVYTFARGRWGRFPDMSEGGPSWWGMLADANAPELESWLYQDIFDATKRPDDVDLFIQPGGFSPDAENTDNLPPGYYIEQSKGAPDWYVKRMVENRPGYSRAGKPVYPEFNHQVHVSNAVHVIRTLPLMIGLDPRGCPSAVFVQRLPNGVWWIIDELVGEQGMGALRFGAALAKKLGQSAEKGFEANFADCRIVRGWADPSGSYGADKKAGEQDWIEIVAKAAGIRISPAPSNRMTPRLEAVRHPLCTNIDGGPAFLVHGRCVLLIKGFNSGYHFRKMNLAGTERYTDEPEKNEFSHPHDALQYVLLANGENMEIRDRKQRSQGDLRQLAAAAQTDWDPMRH